MENGNGRRIVYGPVLFMTRQCGKLMQLSYDTIREKISRSFLSGFRWEDSVGPKAQRPSRPELAWGVIETNQFGLNEFVDWSRKAGSDVMMAVNLGTRGPEEGQNRDQSGLKTVRGVYDEDPVIPELLYM